MKPAELSAILVVLALAVVGDLWRRQPRPEAPARVVEVAPPDEDPGEEPEDTPLDLDD